MLESKLRLTLPFPSNLLLHYLAKSKRSTKQLYIHINKNNKPHVRRHLFHEFLFAYSRFLPDADVFVTLFR